jgi:hypothetical protein
VSEFLINLALLCIGIALILIDLKLKKLEQPKGGDDETND